MTNCGDPLSTLVDPTALLFGQSLRRPSFDMATKNFDALPLPSFDWSLHRGWRKMRSHGARARYSLERFGDEVVSWVNGLWRARGGRGDLVPWSPEEPTWQPTGLQLEARRRLVERIRLNGFGESDVCPEDALRSLLKNASPYSSDPNVAARPYDARLVRVVREGIVPFLLETLVDAETRSWLANARAIMLKNDVELLATPPELFVTPYTVSRLRVRGNMVELVRRLASMRFLVFVRESRGTVGIFTVEKKGSELRLVFDCRGVNSVFRDPPCTEPSSAAALGQISVEHSREDDLEWSFSGVELRDSLY